LADLEVHELTRGVLVGEVPADADGGAQLAVERFDLVGGVNDAAQVGGKARNGVTRSQFVRQAWEIIG
jgi:hypothetical protein